MDRTRLGSILVTQESRPTERQSMRCVCPLTLKLFNIPTGTNTRRFRRKGCPFICNNGYITDTLYIHSSTYRSRQLVLILPTVDVQIPYDGRRNSTHQSAPVPRPHTCREIHICEIPVSHGETDSDIVNNGTLLVVVSFTYKDVKHDTSIKEFYHISKWIP